MSHVMCHVSHFTCHISHGTIHVLFFLYFYRIEVRIWEINFFKVMFTDNFAHFPTNLSRYYNLFSTLNSRRFKNMCKLPHKLQTQKRASVRLLNGQMKLDISDKPLTQETVQCMCKKSTNFVTITLNLENRNNIFYL